MQSPVKSPTVALFVDGRHRHHVEVEVGDVAQLGHHRPEARDHPELATLEPLQRGSLRELLFGEGQRRVTQQLQGRPEGVAGLVGGEAQRRGLEVGVEDVPTAGIDERGQAAQCGCYVDALGPATRATRELGGGTELVEVPLVVDTSVGRGRRRGQLELRHALEVDQVLVVVDHHRRDAVGHALQLVGGREGEHGLTGVAVAEVDSAFVDELEKGPVETSFGHRGEIGAREQVHVGRLPTVPDPGSQRLRVRPALDRHVDPGGALVVGVDDALVRRDLGVAAPDTKGQLHGRGVGRAWRQRLGR